MGGEATLMQLIRASAAVTVLSNKLVSLGGEKYIDGAIVDPFPIQKAIELGCTDIVVVLTRSRHFRRKPLPFIYKLCSLTYFRKWPKSSRDSLFEHFSAYNEQAAALWRVEARQEPCRLLIVAPHDDTLAGVICTDKRAVGDTISRGYADTMATFRQN
jgi:predicted patatin/cPLA2 family phospholipase